MNALNLLNALWGLAGAGGVAAFRDRAERAASRHGDLIPPGANAVPRLNTTPPGEGVNVIMRELPLRQKAQLLPTLLHTMDVVTRCGQAMTKPQEPRRSGADATLAADVVALAKKAGASSVGFTTIDEDDVFEDYGIPYRSAVVFAIEMDRDRMRTAPSFGALKEVLATYGSLGDVAMAITDRLIRAGFGAYPGFPIGGMSDYVRIAERAGIGAIGYHGMLITPEDGSRVRLNVVYTNRVLPARVPKRR